MTPDEDFIGQLRGSLQRAVAGAEPPHDLLASVVSELREPRGHGWVGRWGSRARPRGWLDALVVSLAVATTIAVVTGALVLVHGRGASGTRPSLPSAQKGLVGILGVLRRPQTEADRQDIGQVLRRRPIQPSIVPVISGLRLATVTAWGAKVFLVPVRLRGGPSQDHTGGIGARGFAGWTHGERLAMYGFAGACCASAANILAGHDWVTGGSGSLNYAVLVVPDGVAKVTLALKHPITATVHNNVAAFKTPGAIENLDAYTMTWYGPTGAIVKHISPPPPRPGPTRAQLIQRAEQSPGSIRAQIANHFALFENPQPGKFGNGADSFQISRPAIRSLPNYVLDTTSGPGNPMVASQTRELTTASGARIWILASRTICMFGPPGERVGACSGNGLAAKTGMTATPQLPDGRKLLVGVVPDTNQTIQVQTTDGQTRTVVVRDGVFITPATSVMRYRIKGVDGKSTWLPGP